MAKEQVSSILRALQILECFMDSRTEWTLKALVEQLGLPTTTVFRQVSTLAERGYLEQDPVRKSYRPGPRLLLLSSAILGQSDLRRTARPELERLSDTLQETITGPLSAIHRWAAGHRLMPPVPARQFWPVRVMIISMSTAAGWSRRLGPSRPIPLQTRNVCAGSWRLPGFTGMPWMTERLRRG